MGKDYYIGMGLLLLMLLGILGGLFIYYHPGYFQDKDYKTPCEEKDFAKAYEVVDILKEIASTCESRSDGGGAEAKSWYTDYQNARAAAEEAERYVVLQEGLYMLEQGDDVGLMKIAVIAKEHNADWLYKELESVARSTGNDELVEKIIKMDPHRATLTPETATVSGILKGYFEVSGQTAKIENKYLFVNLKRIKKGNPKRRKPYYKFSVVIKNEVGSVIFRQVTPLGGYYEEGLTTTIIDEERDHYTYDDVMNEDELSCKFYIPKETYDMKSFTISSEDY